MLAGQGLRPWALAVLLRLARLAVRTIAGLSLAAVSPRSLAARLLLRAGGARGNFLGLARRRRSPRRRGLALPWTIPARDSRLVRLHTARGRLELVREVGCDLEAGVAIENPYGADFRFRHAAGAAQQRQQPSRIGV